MSRAVRLLAGALVAVATIASATACSVLPVPPSPLPSEWATPVAPSPLPSDEVDSPLGLSAEQRSAVRVRNVMCEGIGTGSGFILDDHTIVTNHHVVDSLGKLEVTLSDGTDVDVASSAYATNADFAIITTVEAIGPAATLAPADASTGDHITVVGYPNSEELQVTTGTILSKQNDFFDKAPFVFATSAYGTHGSSGSAVYDTDGKVIGVLYAGDESTGETAIIPVSVLHDFLDSPTLHVENKVSCTPDYL